MLAATSPSPSGDGPVPSHGEGARRVQGDRRWELQGQWDPQTEQPHPAGAWRSLSFRNLFVSEAPGRAQRTGIFL